MTEIPKSGWDASDTFTDGQFDTADKFLAKAESPLELEKETPVDGTAYIIPKPAQSTAEKPDSQTKTAEAILNGQEIAKVKNDGMIKERLTFPPLEGQEITYDQKTPEQIRIEADPYNKVGPSAFTKGPDRPPVAKSKPSFWRGLFGGK